MQNINPVHVNIQQLLLLLTFFTLFIISNIAHPLALDHPPLSIRHSPFVKIYCYPEHWRRIQWYPIEERLRRVAAILVAFACYLIRRNARSIFYKTIDRCLNASVNWEWQQNMAAHLFRSLAAHNPHSVCRLAYWYLRVSSCQNILKLFPWWQWDTKFQNSDCSCEQLHGSFLALVWLTYFSHLLTPRYI